MAEQIDNRDPRRHRSWRELWQLPTLLAAVALLLGGVATTVMTRPRPDVEGMVARAEALIESSRPDEALGVLNDRARAYIGEPYVSIEVRQRFHAARARAISAGVIQRDLEGTANHERIAEEYNRAEDAGFKLAAPDLARLVRSLLSLERYDEAAQRIAIVEDSASGDRIGLRRQLIDAAMRAGQNELADEQLIELDADPMLSVEDRAWLVARQSERRLDDGYTEEAIARLLRVMPRITTASEPIRGELFMMLGVAYARTDALGEASKQLDRAHELVEPGSDLYAQVLLERGLVKVELSENASAREHFETVVASYASSPSFLPAALALAEVISVIAREDPSAASTSDAIEAYSRVADEALHAAASEDMLQRITLSLLQRFEEQVTRDELDAGAQYAQIAEDLWGLQGAPAEVLYAQARISRARADQLLADASREAGRSLDLGDLDPSTRVQAQRWYMRAGDYYRRHADALAGGDDDAAYASSVWDSAAMFDAGGDTSEAIAAYTEFAGSISDDPRLPEATFRLARAYQSVGQYALAAQNYESLLEVALDPERGTGVGPFAVRSYVPLAETYLEDEDPSNDARASDLLEAVLRGEAGGVESPAFGDALSAMGMVHYYAGVYPRAIETLEEAIVRADAPRRVLRLKYLLADAYRLEAESIASTLGEGAIAPTVARSLESTRAEHLNRAIELFAQVRDEGDSVAEIRRTAVEEVYLRNAHFYLGDCAFDLGQYESAIRYYGLAKDAYPEDAASLVALVQIFNAYLELDDIERARTASERARRFYEQLPDEVWDDPTLPVSREDWERWLDSTYELATLRAANYTE